jgi:hypothetical protein
VALRQIWPAVVALSLGIGSDAFAQRRGAPPAPSCNNALVNLGFESGGFAGWLTQDLSQPVVALSVVAAGTPGAFFDSAPVEGAFAVRHGWDGSAPGTISIAQDLSLQEASSLYLQFDYRAAWATPNPSTAARSFFVDIEPAGGGAALQRTSFLTLSGSNLDTGTLRGTVDLSPFAGQDVRVSFEWTVPEAASGAAQFEIDNVMPLMPLGFFLSDLDNHNGAFEPGEFALVYPRWLNCSTLAIRPQGTLSGLTGPGMLTYTIHGATAQYAEIAPGASDWPSGADYSMSIGNGDPPGIPRPALHWDATFRETLSSSGVKDWTLHVGFSFNDVYPLFNVFYTPIETLLHHGITAGCGSGEGFCPGLATTRQEMAAFMLLAREGTGFVPPACASAPFADVPPSSAFCPWIDEIRRRGIVAGCGDGRYCPRDPVGRREMAVFVLGALDHTFVPPPCTVPPFEDVPITSPFCPAIQELKLRGVVAGCGMGYYCAAFPVTRQEMAVFITGTFGLTLYGP